MNGKTITDKGADGFNTKTARGGALQSGVVQHPFAPVYNSESRILILGSLPSVKSRENNFYYGHPQNRFWKMLAKIFDAPLPQTIAQKTEFLLQNKIALWDVIALCQICGSSDSSIKDAVPNNIERILRESQVKKILCNGNTAFALYKKFFGETLQEKYGVEAARLPSTSPANAAWSLEKLTQAWKAAIDN